MSWQKLAHFSLDQAVQNLISDVCPFVVVTNVYISIRFWLDLIDLIYLFFDLNTNQLIGRLRYDIIFDIASSKTQHFQKAIRKWCRILKDRYEFFLFLHFPTMNIITKNMIYYINNIHKGYIPQMYFLHMLQPNLIRFASTRILCSHKINLAWYKMRFAYVILLLRKIR